MKILREVTPDEMVATFLKAEISSKRWSIHPLTLLKEMGLNRSIIDTPVLSDVNENQARGKILKAYRGYGKNEYIFQDFPTDVVWKRILLTKDELSKVRYMKYGYWLDISNGSRSPLDAAKTIQKGIEIFNESNERFLKAADVFRKGIKFPELILVSVNEKSDLVVLEGHLRITAYFLAPEALPKEMEVVVGFSPRMKEWGSY